MTGGLLTVTLMIVRVIDSHTNDCQDYWLVTLMTGGLLTVTLTIVRLLTCHTNDWWIIDCHNNDCQDYWLDTLMIVRIIDWHTND